MTDFIVIAVLLGVGWLSLALLREIGNRLVERAASWILPEGQVLGFRLAHSFARIARRIAPVNRRSYVDLQEAPFNWDAPAAALGELDAALREGHRSPDPVRLTWPLPWIALGVRLENAIAPVRHLILIRPYRNRPYKLLSHTSVWDFADESGATCYHRRRSEVRFRVPRTLLTERGSGVGSQFEGFRAGYGSLADIKILGDEHVAAVLLDHPADRGDHRDLVSVRTLRNSFTSTHEWVALDASQSGKSTLEVRFPAQRRPRDIRLTRTTITKRGNRQRSQPVDDFSLDLVDGRTLFRYSRRMRRGQTYLLTWTW